MNYKIEKELFELAFENANIGMCLVDLKGNIFKANSEMAYIFGYSVQEIEKLNVNDLAIKEDKYISEQFMSDVKHGDISKKIFEKRYIHKEGKLVTCQVTSSGVKDNTGEVVYFISHVQDITEKRHFESQLKKTNEELLKAKEIAEKNEKRLIELNATKDKLFLIIAHDLRGPMSGILSLSDLIIGDEHILTPEEKKLFLTNINSTASNTLVLLDNLLNWGKSLTGQLKPNLKLTDLSLVVQHVIDIVKPAANLKNICINVDIESQTNILMDEEMVKTIFRNLISNAVKFTPKGGEVNVSLLQKQNHIEISISDNGIGIKEEILNKLFKIDTNVTLPGTENEKGSGFGLILCKEFVNKLGGEIWVKSELGKGSVFIFTLPSNFNDVLNNP